MTETTDYPQLVRHPRGTGRHTVDLPVLRIPDLWHLQLALDAEGRTKASEGVHETWALAGDLKTHALKVDAAITPLVAKLEQYEADRKIHGWSEAPAIRVPLELLQELRRIQRGEV